MKKKLLMFSLLPCLFGISSCNNAGTGQNITYQLDLDAKSTCYVYRNNSTTDVEARYSDGWSLTQYGDICFELKSETKKIIYSNSRCGYTISISLRG